MRIVENGLRVRFCKREEGKWNWLADLEDIRLFLHSSIVAVQRIEPRYWLIVEYGNNPLFLDSNPERSTDAYDSSVLQSERDEALLRGDAFSKYWRLYVGDCPGVISLTNPPREDPNAVMSSYRDLYTQDKLPGDVLCEFIAQMTPNDLYFYCYEWTWLSFFAHEEAVEKIKRKALAERFPIDEEVHFDER